MGEMLGDGSTWKNTDVTARARRDPAVFREVVVELLIEIRDSLATLAAPKATDGGKFGPPVVAPLFEKMKEETAPVVEPAKATRGRKPAEVAPVVEFEVEAKTTEPDEE